MPVILLVRRQVNLQSKFVESWRANGRRFPSLRSEIGHQRKPGSPKKIFLLLMDLLIQNGRLIDPSQGIDAKADLLVREGRVALIEGGISHAAAPQAQTLDASGLVVAPGFIDLHTHLREPGREHAETEEHTSELQSLRHLVC